MKDWYALCHFGAEQALNKELVELGVSPEPLEGACLFSADDATALKVLMGSQVMTRLLLAVAHGKPADLDVSSATGLIKEDATFAARCSFEVGAPENLSSQEYAAKLGKQVKRGVNLDEPDVVLFCQVGSLAVCGLDVAGDLSKRYYRIFGNARSFKGTLAASVLFHFGVKGVMLDPFANTGELCIEAAAKRTGVSMLKYSLHSVNGRVLAGVDSWVQAEHDADKDVWCFDTHLANLRSCKKNAKLAGVDKAIRFSKTSAEWMDVKFVEDQLDVIVTFPPQVTKRNEGEEHLKELCYQAEFTVKDGGQMIVVCTNDETLKALDRYAKEYKLEKQEEVVMYSGQLAHTAVCYAV